MVVRASPVPLYIQIDEELRGQIESGELGPLAQVPSETDLADHFSVSRMTARKALDRLVADGMLFRQPGKGTFVAPTKIAHGASQGLSFSAAMAAQGLSCETRVLEAERRRRALERGPRPLAPGGRPGHLPAPTAHRRRRRRRPSISRTCRRACPRLLEADLSGSLAQT